METENIILTVLVACAPAIVAYLFGRRQASAQVEKFKAEAASAIADGYGQLVEDLRTQVVFLQEKVDKLVEENHSQRQELTQAALRMTRMETELSRLRMENHKLGQAAEQMRVQLMHYQEAYA